MNITFLQSKKDTYGVLAFNRLSDTKANVHHFNEDDGHYYYSYQVDGTKQELDLIEEFCAKLTGHYGEKNPYASIDCKHDKVEVSAQKCNKKSKYMVKGKKTDVHPGLPDFKIYECSKCNIELGDAEFKGYKVELFHCDWKKKLITISVPVIHHSKVPKHITNEHDRYYYVDPETESKLLASGFKKTTGCSCGSNGNRVYFSFNY